MYKHTAHIHDSIHNFVFHFTAVSSREEFQHKNSDSCWENKSISNTNMETQRERGGGHEDRIRQKKTIQQADRMK